MEKLRAAIEGAGGGSAVARELGVSPQRLSNWLVRGSVPPEYCQRLESVLRGRARRWDMTHDWHLYWPDLASLPGAPKVRSRQTANA